MDLVPLLRSLGFGGCHICYLAVAPLGLSGDMPDDKDGAKMLPLLVYSTPPGLEDTPPLFPGWHPGLFILKPFRLLFGLLQARAPIIPFTHTKSPVRADQRVCPYGTAAWREREG